MDFVYVIVSGGKDTYLEQTILSIESLKRTNPQGRVTVLVDQGTAQTLEGRRHKLYDTADRVKVVECPASYNNKLRSRYLKTTMYHHMEGDFVYIDGDTLVCGDLREVVGDYDVGGVPDCHYPFSQHPNKNHFAKQIGYCGYRVYGDRYINSGFMVVRRGEKAEAFFRLWEQLWKEGLTHGVSQDQPSLNEANYRMGGIIHELSGVWNCQLTMYGSWIQYLLEAKMLHYFASNKDNTVPYLLSNNDLLRHALDEVYPPALQAILDKPKSAFPDSSRLLLKPLMIEVNESEWYNLTYKLCRKGFFKAIFNAVNMIIFLIMWPYRTIKESRRIAHERKMGLKASV